jgi:hypothetical protein
LYCKFQKWVLLSNTQKMQIRTKVSFEVATKPIQSPKRRSRAWWEELGSTGTCTASSRMAVFTQNSSFTHMCFTFKMQILKLL